MASRVILALAVTILTAPLAWAGSSINTTQPANGVPYSPAPIRLNFGAAASDINALFSNSQGASAPSNPSPGQWWLDTSGVTTYELKIFDGRGNAWLHVATLDTINNIWEPPIGGGLLPTILSATTTDVGSVPQASLYVSGNNSIQSFGNSGPIGGIKVVLFTGNATLVNVPGSLVLPGGTNITQQPGDAAILLQTAAGSWQVIFDSRAGSGGGGGGGSGTRTYLTTTQNLYVAQSGSDASNNCANNLSPCSTIQHAANVAMANFDLGSQSLIINVANGTYAAGANISGQLVGEAGPPSPGISFPTTGLQIVGNPSNPSAVIINDTSSPTFNPAVFSASAGAYYTVSGFSISSVNGYGILSQSSSVLNFGNMIFGNAGIGQISASSNAVANMINGYIVTGNSPFHLGSSTGGFVRLSPASPSTITLSSPTFSTAFAQAVQHSTIRINSGQVIFSGSAAGPQYLVQDTSALNTSPSNVASYVPGNVNGAVLDFSSRTPPLDVTNFTFTGLGTGGSVHSNVNTGAFPYAGTLVLVPGTGASTSGTLTFSLPLHMFRQCVGNLGSGSWNAGATVIGTTVGGDEDDWTFAWNNNGVALTSGTNNAIHYVCVGMGT